jgi:adenylate cyclase
MILLGLMVAGTMTSVDKNGSSAITILLRQAEIEAERTTGWVRIALAVALAVSMLVSAEIASVAGIEEFWARLGLGALAIGALLALGIVSLVLVRTGAYAPWMAVALAAGDGIIIVLVVGATLHNTQLGGNWITIVPAVWAAPLILSVGALRYRPGVQIWATILMVSGLGVVGTLFGASVVLPSTDAAAFAENPTALDLLSLSANLARAVMLALVGAVTTLVMLRARRLLHRAVKEISERASIARFLPAEIAPLMEGSNLEIWRRGKRQEITVLFVDLRGSTALAEHMDPAELSVFVSSFRRRVMQAAGAHGGVVDKFIGDGALLIFGIPEPKPDDAKRAILCAREIIRLIERWNAKRRFHPPVRVGIGLHSGAAFCGVLGAHDRLEFTVLGDVVNVAARIEQATKRFGVSLVASEATIVLAGEAREWQEVGRGPLRGRSGAVVMLVPSDQGISKQQGGYFG